MKGELNFAAPFNIFCRIERFVESKFVEQRERGFVELYEKFKSVENQSAFY